MIDAHLHLGKDLIYDIDINLDEILEAMTKYGLEKVVLYPANSNISLETEREKHQMILEALKKYPNKFYGICQVNPHYEGNVFEEEVKKYIDVGFKGLSVNSQVHGWDPKSRYGKRVFNLARDLKIPLFISVGIGLPLGLPIKLYELIKEYSDIKVVLVHAGKSAFASQVHVLASEFQNVYLETSLGFNMREIKKSVKKYGANRIIMASCSFDEIEQSIYMYKNAGLSDYEFSYCTEKTILEVLEEEVIS